MTGFRILLASVVVTTLAPIGIGADDQPFDLLIRNGRIMDGTGNPWFRADVGIRDGWIVEVGSLSDASSRATIDASDRIIAPGFIDLHSHAAAGLQSDDAARRAAPNLVSQGITTVVINQDGAAMHPLVEQMDLIGSQLRGVNVIFLAGHNAIRKAVMVDDFRRAANQEEIAQMRQHVREAMEAGAYGLSSGLEYSPAIWSTTEEVVALVQEVVPHDGVFVVHERSSGADPFWYFPSQHRPGQPTMIDNIIEMIEVARQTQAKVVATHIKARGAHFWGASRVMIRLINEARARGIRIYADQYPYRSSGSDGRLVLIPRWLRETQGTSSRQPDSAPDYAAALRETLQDDNLADDLRRDITHEITRRGGGNNIVVMEHPDRDFIGQNLRELADRHRVSEVEMAILLQLEGYADRPGGARLRSYSLSELDVEAFAQQAWTATATDAAITLPGDGPHHPRFYGTFPRKIRHYALNRGVVSVENAIRSSTSLPAQILGLRDRGQIRQGFHADLLLFDLQRIRDLATFEEGHLFSEGIDLVLIGGRAVVRDGELTGALPGRIIKNKVAVPGGDSG